MNFKQLVLMNLQALTNFPYIEKDFDAVTDYELLCLVVDHLNEVIKNSNEQNTVIQNLYNAFVEIKDYVDNYFENLDIQEEIDNKLDKMAASGELSDIIAQYVRLQATLSYDTVNDMKNAKNVVDGSIAKTLGFHEYNDKGGAYYKIRNITTDDTIDEMTIIKIENSNTLIAELVPENEMTVKQFGAYGDGIHDDIIAIQKAITYNTFGTVYFGNGTYLISEPIKTYTENLKQCNIVMEKTTIIKASTSIDCLFDIGLLGGSNDGVNNRLSFIRGGILDATNCLYGIRIYHDCMGVNIKDMEIKGFSNYGIYAPKGNTLYPSDLLIDCCYINGLGSSYDNVGIYLERSDNKILNTRINAIKIGVYADAGGNLLQDVHALTIGGFSNTIMYYQKSGGDSFILGSYCDTFETFVKCDVGTSISVTNSYYYSYVENVNCNLFILGNENIKLILKDNIFSVPTPSTKHKGIIFTQFNPQKSIKSDNFCVSDNLINTSTSFEQGDLIFTNYKTYRPFWLASHTTLATDKWLLVGYLIPAYYYNDIDFNIQGYHFNANFKLEKYDTVTLISQSASVKSNQNVSITLGVKYVNNTNGYDVYALYIKQNSGDALKAEIEITQRNNNAPFIGANIYLTDPSLVTETMDAQYNI